MKLFVVGKALVDDVGAQIDGAWVMQGVFSTEVAAVAACEDFAVRLGELRQRAPDASQPGRFFIGPLDLDRPFPVEDLKDWPGAYYP